MLLRLFWQCEDLQGLCLLLMIHVQSYLNLTAIVLHLPLKLLNDADLSNDRSVFLNQPPQTEPK